MSSSTTTVDSGEGEETALGVSLTTKVLNDTGRHKPFLTPKFICIFPLNKGISKLTFFHSLCKISVKKCAKSWFLDGCTMQSAGSTREESTDVTVALVRTLTTPPIVRSSLPRIVEDGLCLHRRGLNCRPLDNVDRLQAWFLGMAGQ